MLVTLKRAVRALFAVYVVARVLQACSSSWATSLLLSVTAVGIGYFWLQRYQVQARSVDSSSSPAHSTTAPSSKGQQEQQQQPNQTDAAQQRQKQSNSLSSHAFELDAERDHGAWRQLVGSSKVADAWELLAGSIVQEFFYDAWFCWLSPDREVPAELRWQLHNAFGQLSRRARGIDWGPWLVRHLSLAMRDTLQLYRRAAAAADQKIGAGQQEQAGPGEVAILTTSSSTSSRRRALLEAALLRDPVLHVACKLPGGHYKVLRGVSALVLTLTSTPDVQQCRLTQGLLRELFANCVLRNTLMYLKPYSVNKLLIASLEAAAAPAQLQQQQQQAATQQQRQQQQQGVVETPQETAARFAARVHHHHQAEQLSRLARQPVSATAPLPSRTLPDPLGPQAVSKRSKPKRSQSYDDLSLPRAHTISAGALRSALSITAAAAARRGGAGLKAVGRISRNYKRFESASGSPKVLGTAANSAAGIGDGQLWDASGLPRPGSAPMSRGADSPPPPAAAHAKWGLIRQQLLTHRAVPHQRHTVQDWTIPASYGPGRASNVQSIHRIGAGDGSGWVTQRHQESPVSGETWEAAADGGIQEEVEEVSDLDNAGSSGPESSATMEQYPKRHTWSAATATGRHALSTDGSPGLLLRAPPAPAAAGGGSRGAAGGTGVPGEAWWTNAGVTSTGQERVTLQPPVTAQVTTYHLVTKPGAAASSSKASAVFHVQVEDGSGKWTVERRFRHFEALHKLLRQQQPVLLREAGGPALPPKRLMAPRDVVFLAKRSWDLNRYLQFLIAHPGLATSSELGAFLLPGEPLSLDGLRTRSASSQYSYGEEAIQPSSGSSSSTTSGNTSPGRRLLMRPGSPPTAAAAAAGGARGQQQQQLLLHQQQRARLGRVGASSPDAAAAAWGTPLSRDSQLLTTSRQQLRLDSRDASVSDGMQLGSGEGLWATAGADRSSLAETTESYTRGAYHTSDINGGSSSSTVVGINDAGSSMLGGSLPPGPALQLLVVQQQHQTTRLQVSTDGMGSTPGTPAAAALQQPDGHFVAPSSSSTAGAANTSSSTAAMAYQDSSMAMGSEAAARALWLEGTAESGSQQQQLQQYTSSTVWVPTSTTDGSTHGAPAAAAAQQHVGSVPAAAAAAAAAAAGPPAGAAAAPSTPSYLPAPAAAPTPAAAAAGTATKGAGKLLGRIATSVLPERARRAGRNLRMRRQSVDSAMDEIQRSCDDAAPAGGSSELYLSTQDGRQPWHQPAGAGGGGLTVSPFQQQLLLQQQQEGLAATQELKGPSPLHSTHSMHSVYAELTEGTLQRLSIKERRRATAATLVTSTTLSAQHWQEAELSAQRASWQQQQPQQQVSRARSTPPAPLPNQMHQQQQQGSVAARELWPAQQGQQAGGSNGPQLHSAQSQLVASQPLSQHPVSRVSGAAAAASAAVPPGSLQPTASSSSNASTGYFRPLYDLVDAVFQLSSKGIIRRNAIMIGQQLLSLLIGGTIEDYLKKQLDQATSEDSIAQAVHSMQAMLWPGGIWYQYAQQQAAAAAAAAAAVCAAAVTAAAEDALAATAFTSGPAVAAAVIQPPSTTALAGAAAGGGTAGAPGGASGPAITSSSRSLSCAHTSSTTGCSTPAAGRGPPASVTTSYTEAGGGAQTGSSSSSSSRSSTAAGVKPPTRKEWPPGTSAATYMNFAVQPQDECEVAEAARKLLASLPVPPAMGAVLGKGAYHKTLTELHDIMQCEPVMMHLGHRLLQEVVTTLYPELAEQIAALQAGLAAEAAIMV